MLTAGRYVARTDGDRLVMSQRMDDGKWGRRVMVNGGKKVGRPRETYWK